MLIDETFLVAVAESGSLSQATKATVESKVHRFASRCERKLEGTTFVLYEVVEEKLIDRAPNRGNGLRDLLVGIGSREWAVLLLNASRQQAAELLNDVAEKSDLPAVGSVVFYQVCTQMQQAKR